jgi:hypothetical protein
MKTFPSNFSIVMAIALIGAAGFYIGHKTAPQPQVPIVATAPAEAPAAAPPRPVEPVGALPAAAPAAAPVAAATDASVSKEPPAVLAAGDAAFQRALGSLLQTNATVREKMAVWRELRSKGQLDDALSYLEEAAANNPGNAAYPTALAEGYYTKLQSGRTANHPSRNSPRAMSCWVTNIKSSARVILPPPPGNWACKNIRAMRRCRHA